MPSTLKSVTQFFDKLKSPTTKQYDSDQQKLVRGSDLTESEREQKANEFRQEVMQGSSKPTADKPPVMFNTTGLGNGRFI
ncbi:hypothetical protein BCR33DRAFT_721883 [Rhizoclosmatium globosum]|uniref:Uncharacterized protein n=1 Tax=Rhizoclosmatium globosum TaxID=329046 RepID=A0A1Y2BPJ9_9FUNG|nr:hypothetical protein BCR33DRAFT_721883 [Rhizoclosmatium globosum]|eukprot:ORY36669.1 hypothetical protein BCR33DRAFT_721883 [Rhizoclosmatium globosum]